MYPQCWEANYQLNGAAVFFFFISFFFMLLRIYVDINIYIELGRAGHLVTLMFAVKSLIYLDQRSEYQGFTNVNEKKRNNS